MSVTETDELGFEAPVAVGMPVRANLPQGLKIGPDIGEKLPDFSLPDQNGNLVAAGGRSFAPYTNDC